MSLNTLLTSVSGIIRASHINDILSALRLQFVGRNSSGVPAAGQDCGTLTYPWGAGHFQSLNVGGESLDISNIVTPGNRVISGAVRTNSEQPQFLDITGANDEITVLGTTTNLELSINAIAVSVAADILFQSLTTAPGTNNTCLVDDTTLTDQLSSKYTGEDESTLNIDTAGTEITSRVGELIALKKNGSTEIMLAYVKSVTELTNIYRGFFYDSSDAPIVRETLANNDQLDIMSLGWIFIENTGTSGEITYLNPIYSYTEPAAATSSLYWFDMANNVWKRGDGADFVQINRTLVGLVVIDGTNAIGYRPTDFYHDYRDTNTINLEIFSDEIIRSRDKTNNVYVYSKTLRVDPTKITWDNTADMETGSVAASTKYYLYAASTGETKISLEKEYTRNDLGAKYHPYEAWRKIGEGLTDSSSDWEFYDDEVERGDLINSGSELFTSSGSFAIPFGITTISVCCIGGGGGGTNGAGNKAGKAGGGGALRYGTILNLTPGDVWTVTVGAGGAGGGSPAAGGNSVFTDGVTTITAGGGAVGGTGTGGTGSGGTGGGSGGDGGVDNTDFLHNGGGGAAGYSGDGGDGRSGATAPQNGSGGAGAGGNPSVGNPVKNGGGTGIVIEGASGQTVTDDDGEPGSISYALDYYGYGGGGSEVAGSPAGAAGKQGVVRVVWGFNTDGAKIYPGNSA